VAKPKKKSVFPAKQKPVFLPSPSAMGSFLILAPAMTGDPWQKGTAIMVAGRSVVVVVVVEGVCICFLEGPARVEREP